MTKEYPVSVAAYYPATRTMTVHHWAIEHFPALRRGHSNPPRNFGAPLARERAPHPTLRSGRRVRHALRTPGKFAHLERRWRRSVVACRGRADWELFRVLRACVDLRLHSREVKKVFPDPAVELWTQYPVMGKHLADLTSELHRCASLPAQALGYVLNRRQTTYEGCLV